MTTSRLKESPTDFFPLSKYLLRVSPGLPEIDSKGFLTPHRKRNGHGKTVPLIHARQAKEIARIFAGPLVLERKNLNFFTLMGFLATDLQKRSQAKITDHSENLYQEYFALANIGQLAFAYIYQWVDLENGGKLQKLADFTSPQLEDILRSGKTHEEVWDELVNSNLPSSVRVSS